MARLKDSGNNPCSWGLILTGRRRKASNILMANCSLYVTYRKVCRSKVYIAPTVSACFWDSEHGADEIEQRFHSFWREAAGTATPAERVARIAGARGRAASHLHQQRRARRAEYLAGEHRPSRDGAGRTAGGIDAAATSPLGSPFTILRMFWASDRLPDGAALCHVDHLRF